MNDSVFGLRLRYTALFDIDIPNEPTWPQVACEDPERFERLLVQSVQDKKDYLTAAYGAGWNELPSNRIY